MCNVKHFGRLDCLMQSVVEFWKNWMGNLNSTQKENKPHANLWRSPCALRCLRKKSRWSRFFPRNRPNIVGSYSFEFTTRNWSITPLAKVCWKSFCTYATGGFNQQYKPSEIELVTAQKEAITPIDVQTATPANLPFNFQKLSRRKKVFELNRKGQINFERYTPEDEQLEPDNDGLKTWFSNSRGACILRFQPLIFRGVSQRLPHPDFSEIPGTACPCLWRIPWRPWYVTKNGIMMKGFSFPWNWGPKWVPNLKDSFVTVFWVVLSQLKIDVSVCIYMYIMCICMCLCACNTYLYTFMYKIYVKTVFV